MAQVKNFKPEEHMIDLKGKKYLQVMWRLVWFREEHPDWSISTELISSNETAALFKATIIDDTGSVLATAHGSETTRDFRDFIEKAETKAIGRALAILGYGTQFAPEMDEGERIVDSPVNIPKYPAIVKCEECGKAFEALQDKFGAVWSAEQIAEAAKMKYGKKLCRECGKKVLDVKKGAKKDE